MGANFKSSRLTSNFPQSKQQIKHMHTGHFPTHNLFNGNYTAVFLFHRNIFLAGLGIFTDSKMKLASCKSLLQELKSYSDSPLTYPSSIISLHTWKSPWRKASSGPGLPQSTYSSKRLNKPIDKVTDVHAQALPKQRALLTKC